MARIAAQLNVANGNYGAYSFTKSHIVDVTGATADIVVSINTATVKSIPQLRAAFDDALLLFSSGNYLTK